MKVFSTRHNQHWKVACLISISVLLITFRNSQDGHEDTSRDAYQSSFSSIFSISIVWALLRLFGILDNSIDDLDIFSKLILCVLRVFETNI